MTVAFYTVSQKLPFTTHAGPLTVTVGPDLFLGRYVIQGNLCLL